MRAACLPVLLALLPALVLSPGCGGGGGGDGDQERFPDEVVLATLRLDTGLGTAAVPERLMLCLGESSLDSGVAVTVATLQDGDVGPTSPVREADQPGPFQNLAAVLTDGALTTLQLCFVPEGQQPICFDVDDVDDLEAIVAKSADDFAGYEITGLRFDAERVSFLSDPDSGFSISGNLILLGQLR